MTVPPWSPPPGGVVPPVSPPPGGVVDPPVSPPPGGVVDPPCESSPVVSPGLTGGSAGGRFGACPELLFPGSFPPGSGAYPGSDGGVTTGGT